MVRARVKLPPQPHVGNADSGTRGSTTGQYAVPRSQFNFTLSPDTVLPSIERPSNNEATYNVSTPSTSVAGTSLFSLTPPRSAPGHDSSPGNTRQGRNTISVLDPQLGGLRFSSTNSSIDLNGISDALRDVAAGRDSRSCALLDPTPSPRRLSAHRRRSSSRSNLQKHNVRDEAPPNDRFNRPAVQGALRDTRGLMSQLADVLGSSAVHNEPDSVMKRLHQQAQDLAKFKCPSIRTVGFVGDSGAGKSSLLNSLLDYRDLARSSNSGEACTCVATEFHFHEREDLAVTVEIFSETELMPQLEDLLKDYRHFHLNRESLEPHELADFEKRAKLANDTFRAMFRGLFVGKDTLIEGTGSMALSTLKSWVHNFDRSTIQQERSGLNPNRCSTLLMELTSDVPGATSIWPWIKKIKVYLNAHILSKGLILVDLPGLRDLNAARRNITERYLLKCDEIFVVANEGRAATDEGVQSVIELAKKAKLSNVGIICTRSDEIKPSEAVRDWKGKPVSKEIQHRFEIIDQHESEVKILDEEVSSFDDAYDDLDDEERAELDQLRRKLHSIEKRLQEHKFDLQQLLITTRNTAVEKNLIGLYKSEVPGDALNVFCASNAIYWDHRDAPKDKAMPHLNLSGILAIREHCMMLVSESQYRAATKYVRDDIGVLLGELDLWIQSGHGSLSAEKKEAICSALNTLEKKLYLGLCGRNSTLNNTANMYEQEFNTKIYQLRGSHVNRWSAAAKGASYDWGCWHHQTFSAFCRNYGTHSTPSVGPRCWNQEIIQEMTDDLDMPWDQLNLTLEEQGEHIVNSINDLFDWADDFLDTELEEYYGTAIALTSTLLSQKRILETNVRTILDELQNNLRTLGTEALSSIRTSFIGQAMEAAYRNARLESGSGSDARRKACINSTVQRNDLFADLMKSFKNGFQCHVGQAQDQIREVVSSSFDDIKDTLDIIRSDNVALESERDPEFRNRIESKLKATKEGMQRVQSILTA